MKTSAKNWVEVFHRHLEKCEQCRDNPWVLCALGRSLLQLAARPPGAQDKAAAIFEEYEKEKAQQ